MSVAIEVQMSGDDRVLLRRNGNDNAVGIFLNNTLLHLSVSGFPDCTDFVDKSWIDITNRFNRGLGHQNEVVLFALDWGAEARATAQIRFNRVAGDIGDRVAVGGKTDSSTIGDIKTFHVNWS